MCLFWHVVVVKAMVHGRYLHKGILAGETNVESILEVSVMKGNQGKESRVFEFAERDRGHEPYSSWPKEWYNWYQREW